MYLSDFVLCSLTSENVVTLPSPNQAFFSHLSFVANTGPVFSHYLFKSFPLL